MNVLLGRPVFIFKLSLLLGFILAKRTIHSFHSFFVARSHYYYNHWTPFQSSKATTAPKERHIRATTTLQRPTIATTKMKSSSSMYAATVSISDAFDGGNGKLNRIENINGQLTVYVDIRKDPFTQLENVHHSQYFSFRSCVQNLDRDETLQTCTVRYVLANAKDVSFPAAWEGSTIFYSRDPWEPSSWRRKLDTTYDGDKGELMWTHDHGDVTSTYFAYFPPYSYQRHLSLISQCEAAPLATVESLGQTLDGREMECVKVGSGDMKCWIIHRQHPGETMAEFYAEGLLTRLLGLDHDYVVDGMVKNVLQMYTFYIVPNMCPDGAVRGYLRTNAGGQNLNREWCSTGKKEDGALYYEAPSLERSPEVYHVLKKMDETGVDAFLDVHGDEALPFNFLAGSEGCPNWSERLKTLHGAFLAQYSRTNSDMQSAIAYNPEEPGQGRMNVCSNQIATRFDCLAATLEMPFKDCLSNPDPEKGWNGARAAMLGASVLEALAYVGPYLRLHKEGDLNHVFGPNDKYVRPTSDYKALY